MTKEKMFYNALLGAVSGAVIASGAVVLGAAPAAAAAADNPLDRRFCDYPLATNPHLPEVTNCAGERYTS